MIYLILSILSSTAIFILFKFLGHLNIPAFPVIVYNYLFATIPGIFFSIKSIPSGPLTAKPWLPMALIIGILFILMFYIIGLSSKKAGISVTTVASKMSVATPIAFSILYDPGDRLTWIKFAGISLALISVFLIVYRNGGIRVSRQAIYLPFLLFAGMGIVDSLVKYAQYRYIGNGELAFFTLILFLVAFVTGLTVLVIKRNLKSLMDPNILPWGIMLGIANFGSVFFLIRSLNYRSSGMSMFDSSSAVCH